MKMNTRQFKALIKECLKELVEEGAFHKMLAESMLPQQQPHGAPHQQHYTQQHYGAGFQPPAPVQPSNPLENAVNSLAWDMSKGDEGQAHLMARLFADTALNTLPGQDNGDPRRMAAAMAPMLSQAPQHHNVGNPQVLSEQPSHPQQPTSQGPTSRWAQIAFAKRSSRE